MAKLPIITHRREIDVRVVYGQSIFELYQQIHNLIQREIPELANLFAEPIVNAVRGEISWNTKATGIIRKGTGLGDAEWSRLKSDLSLIKGLITKLEKAGRSNSAGTEALRCMLVTPDLRNSVFQVGSQLVITQWGCYEFGTDARSANLFEQIEAAPKTPSGPTTSAGLMAEPTNDALPTEETPTGLTEEVMQPPPANPPPPSFVEKGKLETNYPASSVASSDSEPLPTQVDKNSFLWRWLLLLFLTLLLLAGLLVKFWYGPNLGTENSLKTEVARLTNALDQKMSDCVIQAGVVDSIGTQTAPITNSEFSTRQADNQIRPDSEVNVSLAWSDRSDLDLFVFQPDGQAVFFAPCTGASCGQLDVDANRCNVSRPPCTGLTDRPLENISWPNKMITGTYVVAVALYSTNVPGSAVGPVRYTVQIKKNGAVSNFEGLIRADEIQCKNNLCGTAPRRVTQFNVE